MTQSPSPSAMPPRAACHQTSVLVELPIGLEEVKQRLSPRARAVRTVPCAARGGRAPMLLFVPGEDESGRHDACLVDANTYERGVPIEGYVGDSIHAFQLGRIRARGRGWVLAAFEIAATMAFWDASAPATA